MWAIFALGAALLTSFNPILYKRILKDADTLTVVWVVTILGIPLLGVFTLLLTPQMPQMDLIFWVAVLGSAGLNVVAHLASTKALQLEDASLVTPLLTFSPLFTALIAAIFLREIPSPRGMMGIGFLLVGAYWLTGSGKEWHSPLRSLHLKPGVFLVLFAGLIWAITPIFEKTAIQHTYPSSPRFTAFIIDLVLVLFLTIPVFRRGGNSLNMLRSHGRDLILAGMIAGTAPVLGYTAFSLGPVGYVTTLFKFSSLITLIWAAIFLQEHHVQERFPAAFLMVTGTILLTI